MDIDMCCRFGISFEKNKGQFLFYILLNNHSTVYENIEVKRDLTKDEINIKKIEVNKKYKFL
jgi:hypothetical protein